VLAYAPISSINSLDPAQLTTSINRYPVIMPLLLPALLLVIPYGDMLLAVVRRTRAGQSPFAADRKHLHHRLLDIGHSQRASVLIMYLWAAAFSGTVVWFSITKTELPKAANHHGEPVIVFVVITVVAVGVLLLLSMPWRHWGERARARRSPAAVPTAPGAGIAAGATARQPRRPDLVPTGAPARRADVQPADAPADGARAREERPQPGGLRGEGAGRSFWYARPEPRGNGIAGGDEWRGDDPAAGNGPPPHRWQRGEEGPGNGHYEADRWPGGKTQAGHGWPPHHGRPASLDGAGDGIGSETDHGDDQDRVPGEQAGRGIGRSVVGTVPPATDWSWFGPSPDPDGHDH